MLRRNNLKISLILVFILFLIGSGAFAWYRYDQRQQRLEQEREAANKLREEKTLKILEGWSAKQIAAELEKIGHPAAASFLEATSASSAKGYVSDFDFLADKPNSADLEGYLFPDTYRIFASSTAEEVVYKLLDNFDRKLTSKMRADIAAQGKSIYDIVTMASLVEKEAAVDQGGNDEDAKIVAGIFWDRIKYGQRLESCATLAYILGVNKAVYTQEDTQIQSPYNTYRNDGLPPGPIANPGAAALEAAIYPTYTAYNYFLTPSGSRGLVFAETYEQHLSNKAKYLSD